MNTFRHHILQSFTTGFLIIVLLNFSVNITYPGQENGYAKAEEIETMFELIFDHALDLTEIAPCADEPDDEQIHSIQYGIFCSGIPGFLILPDYTSYRKRNLCRIAADVATPAYEQACPPPEMM
jgi:hypothetical protein